MFILFFLCCCGVLFLGEPLSLSGKLWSSGQVLLEWHNDSGEHTDSHGLLGYRISVNDSAVVPMVIYQCLSDKKIDDLF